MLLVHTTHPSTGVERTMTAPAPRTRRIAPVLLLLVGPVLVLHQLWTAYWIDQAFSLSPTVPPRCCLEDGHTGRNLARVAPLGGEHSTDDSRHQQNQPIVGSSVVEWTEVDEKDNEQKNVQLETTAAAPSKKSLPAMCGLGSTAAHGDIIFPPHPFCRSQHAFERVRNETIALLSDDVCDVCILVDTMRSSGLSAITFWGDSVQNQVFHDLVCELNRRDYLLLNDTMNNQECPSNGGSPMECMRYIRTARFSTNNDDEDAFFFTVHLAFQYRPKPNAIQDYHQVMTVAPADVLVFNFGLHYTTSMQRVYQQRIRELLQTIRRQKQEKYTSPSLNGKPNAAATPLMVFRETSAQHFPTGEYVPRKLKRGSRPTKDGTKHNNNSSSSYPCVPLPADDSSLGWRDRIVQEAAEMAGFVPITAHPTLSSLASSSNMTNSRWDSSLYILPFAQFSAKFHDLHPGECTHFCSTPFLWYPLWRSLRLAMEDHFGGMPLSPTTAVPF